MGGFLNITCTLCEANSYACISTLLCLQLTRFTPQLSWSDSNGNRTRVTAVKGRCLNRLTMEPYIQFGTTNFCPIKKNSPSRARTYNNSVNSRVLYHWAIEDYFDCFAIIKVCTFKTSYRWSDFLSSFITTYSLCSYVAWRYIKDVPQWLSPRPISNSQLHMLPCFHLCPIYLVVFKGSYSRRRDISSWGGLHA